MLNFIWLNHRSGEAIAFTDNGYYLVTEEVDQGWYFMHNGKKPDHRFYTCIEEAKLASENYASTVYGT